MRKRNAMLGGATAVVAAGLAAGAAVAASGQSTGTSVTPATATSASAPSPAGRMTQAATQWVTGGSSAPGWMRGGDVPTSMTGTGSGPGTAMGALFANAPGPRVSAAQASALGSQPPAGASVDRARRVITFTARSVRLAMVASPSMPAESFRIAGLTDPAISVPAGARVTIELINADPDMAHGLVITPSGADRAAMPMMTAAPAFSGAALWFLGDPTAAGLHAGTLTFTATRPGSYQYMCPVPGHAREGMAGAFTVR